MQPKNRRQARICDGAAWQFFNDLVRRNSTLLVRTPAGMDCETRSAWFEAIANNISSTLRAAQRKFLILDGCRAHISLFVLNALVRVNVEVCFVPTQTTQATQQLEVAVFQPFTDRTRDDLDKGCRALNSAHGMQITLGSLTRSLACRWSTRKTSNPPSSKPPVRARAWGTLSTPSSSGTTFFQLQKRTNKSNRTISRLTARMARIVAKERHELQ